MAAFVSVAIDLEFLIQSIIVEHCRRERILTPPEMWLPAALPVSQLRSWLHVQLMSCPDFQFSVSLGEFAAGLCYFIANTKCH